LKIAKYKFIIKYTGPALKIHRTMEDPEKIPVSSDTGYLDFEFIHAEAERYQRRIVAAGKSAPADIFW